MGAELLVGVGPSPYGRHQPHQPQPRRDLASTELVEAEDQAEDQAEAA